MKIYTHEASAIHIEPKAPAAPTMTEADIEALLLTPECMEFVRAMAAVIKAIVAAQRAPADTQ